MYKELVISNNPKILIITPLRISDKIMKDCKKSIKRNSVKFDWISFSSNNNPIQNCKLALSHYKKKLPKYIMKLDNDVISDRNWLDQMYKTLENSSDEIAYTYTSHEFFGYINVKFPVMNFNKEKLLKQNYISYNSLIKTEKLIKIGGFVDLKGQSRLWDWSLWLTFMKNGYIGIPTYNKNIKLISTPNGISAQSKENYKYNYDLVIKHIMEI